MSRSLDVTADAAGTDATSEGPTRRGSSTPYRVTCRSTEHDYSIFNDYRLLCYRCGTTKTGRPWRW